MRKQIRAKVPMLLYIVGPKHPSGNYYIICFLTDRTALNLLYMKKFNVKISANSAIPLSKSALSGKRIVASWFCLWIIQKSADSKNLLCKHQALGQLPREPAISMNVDTKIVK